MLAAGCLQSYFVWGPGGLFLLQVFSCIADYTFSSHPYAFLAHTVIPKTALLLAFFFLFFQPSHSNDMCFKYD